MKGSCDVAAARDVPDEWRIASVLCMRASFYSEFPMTLAERNFQGQRGQSAVRSVKPKADRQSCSCPFAGRLSCVIARSAVSAFEVYWNASFPPQ